MQTTNQERSTPKQEGLGLGLAIKYSLASLCGFATDLALLKVAVAAGLSPALARVISLTTAMQVTFLINGLMIFKCLELKRLHLQWGGYMLTNAFGNICNYLAFSTLLSLHRSILSNHTFAVTLGAFAAWTINYIATRFVVFRRKPEALGARQDVSSVVQTRA